MNNIFLNLFLSVVENGKISWDENFEVEAILDHVVEKVNFYKWLSSYCAT